VTGAGGATPRDAHALRVFENPGHRNDWIGVKLLGVKTTRAALSSRRSQRSLAALDFGLRVRVAAVSEQRSIFSGANSASAAAVPASHRGAVREGGALMASIELRDGLPPAGFGQYNQQCEGEAMTTAVKAVYEDGVFEPKEPVELEEHAEYLS